MHRATSLIVDCVFSDEAAPDGKFYCQLCRRPSNDPHVHRNCHLDRDPLAKPCVERGEPNGEKIACGKCRNKTRLKVFSCGTHGRCLPATIDDRLPSCLVCLNYRSENA